MFRFTNDDSNLSQLDSRTVYFPAATDTSEEGGQSLRVTRAVRRAIALDTRYKLSTKSESSIALDLQILSSKRTSVEIKECKQGNEFLAAGSKSCVDLKRDFRFPNSASEKERRYLTVRARIVDLSSGKLLNQAEFKDVSSGDYDVVADDSSKGALVPVPELHALRYLENNDSAVERMGTSVASQVMAMLLATSATSDH